MSLETAGLAFATLVVVATLAWVGSALMKRVETVEQQLATIHSGMQPIHSMCEALEAS